MKVEIKGNELVITMPFDKKGTISGSQKSDVHSSTNGNKDTGVKVNGKPLMLGLNAYTSRKGE